MEEEEILEMIKKKGTRVTTMKVIGDAASLETAVAVAELLAALESQRVLRRGSIVDTLFRMQEALTN